ncbi:MAG: isoleucine--tRNA ligase [Actinomycetales bacterium]|nr:isoleucine--tRNA ligase [Actinomycetales bacterium]
MYSPVSPRIDLVAMEHEVIDFWREHKVFERSLSSTADGPRWVFYEGPPTANGKPGTHHIEARVFKDIFPRFKTMKGWHVPRKAGWDCHGLPVELAIEKKLGFSGKTDIERHGVAAFNSECRASVLEHVAEFAELTQRLGYWVDMDAAYFTMAPEYVDSVWWSLQRIFEKGLLVQDHRVTPYCPRCGTGLSDHELGQPGGYENVTDPAAFVRMPVAGGALAEAFPGLALLVWTTTPWTLVSNTACAVNPSLDYVVAQPSSGGPVIMAADLVTAVLGEDAAVLRQLAGADVVGLAYSRPLDWVAFPETDAPLHTVVAADFVTADEGTGVVHEAPAFGAEDLTLCRSYGLPVVNPIGPDGCFTADVPVVGGQFFKDADATVLRELTARGVLFRSDDYEHSYPHCWRCHTPLMYYAQPSWYIRTTAIKEALLRENEATRWYPRTIQWGRYGDWLHNNVDWALSRNRYWGTPLPIWRCPDGHLTCIGSRAELGALAGLDLSEADPHRPYVDDITFACGQCGHTAQRVPEVIDCWYDSGAMPFAQFGYPHHNADEFAASYPANFIAEAIDQTRGWFYTLMAVGTLVHDQSAYRDVLCLGHLVDEQGRKMSKHLGNVIEPMPLMDEHGADAVRWFMLAAGSPWQARRVGHAGIAEIVRKVLLTYWNTVSFHVLYANAADFDATAVAPAPQDRPVMDRWLLAESARVARAVDAALEDYDTQSAGRLLADLIDDMSNWYVRRSRRRFWEGDPAAFATLHTALKTVTALMAPFVPFITERVWQDLFTSADTASRDSVHLQPWPVSDTGEVVGTLDDAALLEAMRLTRDVVELGRAARASAALKTRQPLASALVTAENFDVLTPELIAELADELNVHSVTDGRHTSDLTEVTVKANFRSLGARFAQRTPTVAAAINALAGADASGVVASLRGTGVAQVMVEGQPEAVTIADVTISETSRTGWAVAMDKGVSVALDTELTDELRALGAARDVVRAIQEARKQAGLDISDRIEVTVHSSDPLVAQALSAHGAAISSEVLAVRWQVASLPPAEPAVADADLGLTAAFSVVR